MAPNVGLHSRGVLLLGVSWRSQPAMQLPGRSRQASCSWLAGPPREGYFQGCLSSCWNCLFQGFFLFLSCLALAANFCFWLVEMEMCIWYKLMSTRTGEPTSVHVGNLPLVLFWHFASWFWRASAIEGSLCWGSLVWDSVLVILSANLWRICLLVCVYSICMIDILVAFL